MKVTAIVVHRDQPQRCRETIERLAVQGVRVKVVVVDNGSSAHARRSIAARPDVALVDAGGNLGFGGGANVALRRWLDDPSAGEWVLVLPHDAIPEPGCLAVMLDAVRDHPSVGLVSAEFGDDEVPAIDPYFGAATVAAKRGEGFREAAYAHGTFLLLRRACLDEVGVFDESYFAYCEEADLALRAARRGWRSGIVWGAVVRNPHQGSPPPLVDYLMVRNTVLLVRRHFGRYRAVVRVLIVAFTLPWYALRRSRRSPWFSARARLLALRDVVAGRVGPPPVSLARR